MLCDTLEKNHYNLYANVSEEEFQAEREKIARQTAKMTDEEFYWSVCHLISLIGDAHTMAYVSGDFMEVCHGVSENLTRAGSSWEWTKHMRSTSARE